MTESFDLKEELKDGVKAGGGAGLAFGAAVYVMYLGLQGITILGSETFDLLSFLSFTAVILTVPTALGIVPGIVGSVIYASLREKLDRHDLAFAACISVLIIGVVAQAGIQFLVLFIPAAVYMVMLERLYDRR